MASFANVRALVFDSSDCMMHTNTFNIFQRGELYLPCPCCSFTIFTDSRCKSKISKAFGLCFHRSMHDYVLNHGTRITSPTFLNRKGLLIPCPSMNPQSTCIYKCMCLDCDWQFYTNCKLTKIQVLNYDICTVSILLILSMYQPSTSHRNFKNISKYRLL